MVGLLKAHGFRVFGLLKDHRYFYGWFFRGLPGFVWLDSNRPHGFHMADLSKSSRFSYDWTFRCPPVFVWLVS